MIASLIQKLSLSISILWLYCVVNETQIGFIDALLPLLFLLFFCFLKSLINILAILRQVLLVVLVLVWQDCVLIIVIVELLLEVEVFLSQTLLLFLLGWLSVFLRGNLSDCLWLSYSPHLSY